MAQVVVIGGGLGGVASAVRLAKLGHEVTLLERRDQVGGAVGVLEQDGFRWDTGPHATALPAVLRDLFRKSGRPLERELELVPLEPLREHRFADGTRLVLPSGRAGQLEAVEAALGQGTGRQWVHYVHEQGDVWDRLRRDWLERPWSPGSAPAETEALLRHRRMLHRETQRRFKDERLRVLARHHAVQGGHDPRNVPAWFGMLDYIEQNFGVWTIPGGFGALAGLLAKRLRERKVTVLTGVTARDVVMDADRPRAVATDTGPIAADVVVVGVDARSLPALAPHVRRTMPALPPAVAHLGLRGDVPALPHETVIHDDYVLTVRNHGPSTDGTGVAWTVSGRGRLAEDLLLALARKRLDVRDAVVTRVDRSPRDIAAEYAGSPWGALWQGPATIDQRLTTRTPLPGVYAVGAHVGGGGWLPFVGLSAAQAAEEIGPA